MTITRNQRNLNESNEILPPSTKSSIKAECLKTTQAIFSKDLSEAEIKFWWEFLNSYKEAEISWAFDAWNRNQKFFPRPGDIRELIDSYRDSNRPAYRARDYPGNGFGKVELLALWELVNERMAQFKKQGTPYQSLTDQEIDELCRQVEERKHGKQVA